MPFFSVIVPIYQVEKYLRECVDSILGQTFTDLECILVDDGSPDGCPAICDDYAGRDGRVRVIHKENGGLSDARNAGMRIAEGRYFCFVDSDDYWCSPDCLDTMYHELERSGWAADIAVYRFCFYSEETKVLRETKVRYDTEYLNALGPVEAMQETIQAGKLLASASEGCYRADYLREHNLYFRTGIRSEDTEWIVRIYGHPPKIWYTNHAFYTYRSRPGSITSTPDLQKCYEYGGFLMEHADSCRPDEPVDYLRLCFLAYHYLVCLANTRSAPKSEARAALLKKLYSYQFLIQYDLTPKVRIAHRVKQIFGIRITAWLLGKYVNQN